MVYSICIWLQFLFFYPLVKWHEQGKGSGSYCLQSQEVMVGESCQYHIKQRKKGKGLFITEEPYPPFLQLLKTPPLLMCSVAAEHLSIFFFSGAITPIDSHLPLCSPFVCTFVPFLPGASARPRWTAITPLGSGWTPAE